MGAFGENEEIKATHHTLYWKRGLPQNGEELERYLLFDNQEWKQKESLELIIPHMVEMHKFLQAGFESIIQRMLDEKCKDVEYISTLRSEDPGAFFAFLCGRKRLEEGVGGFAKSLSHSAIKTAILRTEKKGLLDLRCGKWRMEYNIKNSDQSKSVDGLAIMGRVQNSYCIQKTQNDLREERVRVDESDGTKKVIKTDVYFVSMMIVSGNQAKK